MEITLIAAVSENGIVGVDGRIPWSPYEGDQKRFKEVTLEHSVIMGRLTADELKEIRTQSGKPIFPLNKRRNIVLTSNLEYTAEKKGELMIARNMKEALEMAEGRNPDGIVYGIGGQNVYDFFIDHPLTTRLEITAIPETIDVDNAKSFAGFPPIGNKWELIKNEPQDAGHVYKTYTRK